MAGSRWRTVKPIPNLGEKEISKTCLVPIGASMTAIAIILTLSAVALGMLIMWLLWKIVSASNGSPTGNGNS